MLMIFGYIRATFPADIFALYDIWLIICAYLILEVLTEKIKKLDLAIIASCYNRIAIVGSFNGGKTVSRTNVSILFDSIEDFESLEMYRRDGQLLSSFLAAIEVVTYSNAKSSTRPSPMLRYRRY